KENKIFKSGRNCRTKKGSTRRKYFDRSRKVLTLENVPIGLLINDINNMAYKKNKFIQFLDETRYKGTVDVEIPWAENLSGVQLEELQISLRKYGLDLVRERREMNVLLIKSKP